MKYFFCTYGKLNLKKWLTIKILIFGISLSVAATGLDAKENNQAVQLEKIIVTPERRKQETSGLTRSAVVVDKDDIGSLPISTPDEVLEYVQGVDLRRRSGFGVQSDITIRGSSFEQVVVLVNGTKMNDAQTGHYTMDLPLSLDDIERVEVLRGGSSCLYGTNAFGGVVNIITKTPTEEKIKFGASIGEHSLSSQNITVDLPSENTAHHFSIERRESSGYRPDTDFENLTVYLQSLLNKEKLPVDLNIGYAKKDYGAANFYSNLYPHQEEHTDTRFFNFKTTVDKDWFKLSPSVFYRRHWDKYILDRNRPWWYVNFHTTYTYGAEIQGEFNFDKSSFIAGLEAREEKITSTNLGNHKRDNEAVFAMYSLNINDKAAMLAGLRQDYFQDWGWQTMPSVSANYFLTPRLKLRSAVDRLFRIPSYTELYYNSPANRGSENLSPEKGWSYESGFDYIEDNFRFAVTPFWRREKDAIDWARESSLNPWQAQNVNSINTQGTETEMFFSPLFLKEKFSISSLNCGYSYIYATQTQNTVFTKYAPLYLRHHANAGLNFDLPFGIKQSLILSYKERFAQRHYFLLDSKLSKKIEKDKFDIEFFVNAANLLNTSYSEITDVVMPGRWIEAGFNVGF